jgi:hypothetical protein
MFKLPGEELAALILTTAVGLGKTLWGAGKDGLRHIGRRFSSAREMRDAAGVAKNATTGTVAESATVEAAPTYGTNLPQPPEAPTRSRIPAAKEPRP